MPEKACDKIRYTDKKIIINKPPKPIRRNNMLVDRIEEMIKDKTTDYGTGRGIRGHNIVESVRVKLLDELLPLAKKESEVIKNMLDLIIRIKKEHNTGDETFYMHELDGAINQANDIIKEK